MSSEELVHPPELPAEFGGAKRHNKKKVIVVGKVYANWCGHCKSLKPEWKKMKKRVYSRRGNKQVVFEEIEEKQMTNKLPKLKKHHGVDIDVNGFPTVFKIENGKVDYYSGNRNAEEMARWYLKGGSPKDDPMPVMMQDQQGGRRYHHTRRHRHFRGFRGANRTRKHYAASSPNKSAGLFDFLFGK